MEEFFHCSHEPNFHIGTEFHLFPNVMYQPQNSTLYTQSEAYQKYDQLYPNGISNHGINHLSFYPKFIENANYHAEKTITEQLFETIRQRNHPNCPSRFMSYFGCLNLEDAETVITTFFNTPRTIYRVSCKSAFIADMRWVELGESIPGTFLLAERYWSQQHSHKPLLEALMTPPIKILEKVR